MRVLAIKLFRRGFNVAGAVFSFYFNTTGVKFGVETSPSDQFSPENSPLQLW